MDLATAYEYDGNPLPDCDGQHFRLVFNHGASVAEALQQLSDDANKWQNLQHIQFSGGYIDSQSIHELLRLLQKRPAITRLTFDPDCTAALTMARAASLSQIVARRPVQIEGSLPRAMGRFQDLVLSETLRSSLRTFDPVAWSFEWSAEDEVLPTLPNVTNCEHSIIGGSSDELLLREIDDDGLRVTWGVRTSNLTNLVLDSALAVGIVSSQAQSLLKVEKLTLVRDCMRGRSDAEVATLLDAMRNLRELTVEDMPFPRLMNILALRRNGHLKLDYSLHLDSRYSMAEMVPDFVDTSCTSLVLRVSASERLWTLDSRSLDSMLAVVCSSFSRAESLEIRLNGCGRVGGFLSSVPSSLVSLNVSWSSLCTNVPEVTIVCAINDLEHLADLTLSNWPLGTTVLSELRRRDFQTLHVPDARASAAALRHAMSKTVEELDIGLRIIRSDDAKRIAECICTAAAPPERMTLRTPKAKELATILQSLGLHARYSYLSEREDFLVIHF